MNTNILARQTLRLVLLAIGIAIAGGPVVAQEVSEITVVAPRPVTRVVGRTSSGVPVELVTLTRHVSYADLDLAKSADAAALEARVNDTAKEACKQLDTLYPLRSSDPECFKKAVDGAMVQVKAAVAAAIADSNK